MPPSGVLDIKAMSFLFGSLTASYLPCTISSLSHCKYKASAMFLRTKLSTHQLSLSVLREKRLEALGVIKKRAPISLSNHLAIDLCDSIDSASDRSNGSINLLESSEADDRELPTAKTPAKKRVRKTSPTEAQEVKNNPLNDDDKSGIDDSKGATLLKWHRTTYGSDHFEMESLMPQSEWTLFISSWLHNNLAG
jgi:hypothetical protein